MVPKYEVGQKVRVVANKAGHQFEIGSMVEVLKVLEGDQNVYDLSIQKEGYPRWYGYESDLAPLEVEASPAKDTNPKDAIAASKLPLNVVPDTLKVYATLAFTEGALKYGSMNWRVAGVRASIYKAALERHLAKYWNGEWADPVTGVPHLASVIACAGIILDANAAGKLTDDRPPAIPLAGIIDGLEPAVKHLQELFKDKHPHHHTEADKLGPVIPK
jgi:hypothetical protein